MGRREGALKTAAKRLGLGLEEYLARLQSGLKWCGSCKADHPRDRFGRDATRGDGLDVQCLQSRREMSPKKPARPKESYRRGWVANVRDGDRKQARRRVNYLVEQGRIRRPNDLPCCDCGHLWMHGEPRHEYDHHRGYDGASQLDVQPVCVKCHRQREKSRRG